MEKMKGLKTKNGQKIKNMRLLNILLMVKKAHVI